MEHFLPALAIVTFIAVNIALMFGAMEFKRGVWRMLSVILIFIIWVAGISLISYSSSKSEEDNKTCVKYEKRVVPVGKTLVTQDHCTAWLVEE